MFNATPTLRCLRIDVLCILFGLLLLAVTRHGMADDSGDAPVKLGRLGVALASMPCSTERTSAIEAGRSAGDSAKT